MTGTRGLFTCVLAALLFVALDARADTCTHTCAEGASDYWSFSNIGSSADNVKVGLLYGGLVGWVPVACESNTAYVDSNVHTYPSTQLTNDVLMCLGSGNDQFNFIVEPFVCNGTTMFPFSDGGYTFSIRGQDGNDSIRVDGYAGETDICGEDGDDKMNAANSSGHNYMWAGANDDYLEGGLGDDTYRAYSGKDWLVQLSGTGTDSLKGYTGDDCSDAQGSVHYLSSCETDDTNDYYWSGTVQLDSCEVLTTNCCTALGGAPSLVCP